MSRYKLQWKSVDPLGQVLHSLQMSGAFYCRCELSEPWGLTMPPMAECLWFHCVLSGQCELLGETIGSVTLEPGGFVLISHGAGHALRTAPGVAIPNVLDVPHEMVGDHYGLLRYGRGGATCVLICGVVRLQHEVARDLVSVLPPLIHQDSFSPPQSNWMQSTMQLMAAEAQRQSLGGETVVTRLADILVVQAIRSWLASKGAAATGWLGALQDPAIGRCLAAMHHDPANNWTVRSLAAAAAMSRSAFALRFAELVGKTPLEYLTGLRMRAACRLLSTDARVTVGEVAAQFGYQSEAAFSRAFKRMFGATPAAVRRGNSK